MFFPEGRVRVFVYGRPVDMRLGFTGLYALTRHGLQQDPLESEHPTSFFRAALH